jgi:hypothetical protein
MVSHDKDTSFRYYSVENKVIDSHTLQAVRFSATKIIVIALVIAVFDFQMLTLKTLDLLDRQRRFSFFHKTMNKNRIQIEHHIASTVKSGGINAGVNVKNPLIIRRRHGDRNMRRDPKPNYA